MKRNIVSFLLGVSLLQVITAAPQVDVDYESFLSNHDMVWDRIPDRWEVAPYTGNGNMGFLFYRAADEAKNVISIYAGRHDYYDHRLPHNGQQHLWIYRCRLPLGRFNLESKGEIESVDLRLDLWNAELTGTIKTSQGWYAVRGLTHGTTDIIYFETEAGEGESVTVSWHPEEPYSSVRKTLEGGGGPKGGTWDEMRDAPYPPPPEPTLSEEGGMQFCFQPLHDHRGETTTGWEVTGDAAGKQVLTASIHHSFPEKDSLAKVKANLLAARPMLRDGTFLSKHREWWHDYYPQSFVTFNDAEKEAFYWIQMYKFASATRENGPILDNMGPWYHYTFWPMVWGDLNVQLNYWTHLAANRLSVGESLPNKLDEHAGNLEKNVPERWKDSMALGALFPQDCLSHDHGKTPDMLAWVLHNYWLHCQHAGDRERMRDKLFPLLRKNVNGYLNYLRENPVDAGDGKVHIRTSWSPEYPNGHGQDINFTIGLLRWACQTLLELNEEHELNDPLAGEWQNIVDSLVEFQVDENGLRIGKDIPFDTPHRHYSHLLAFYPLALITPENAEDAALLRRSVDHWLEVTLESGKKVSAMPATGYTATGAAAMYAWLGDAEKAYHYLDFLIEHKNVAPTTMYAEGNPVIESPLSFATSLHEMLLQSWGGKIRVFPATPDIWPDAAFHRMRAQGAFLVSAKKKAGVTEFVEVESLIGSPCIVQTGIAEPKIHINGKAAEPGRIQEREDGFYEIALKKGEKVTFTRVAFEEADLRIAPVPVGAGERNLFGLNEKTTRLPGHQFYHKEAVPEDKEAAPEDKEAAPKKEEAAPEVSGVEEQKGDRVWTPAEIGRGAFSLEPDRKQRYKTVAAPDGTEAELELHLFLPPGHAASDKRPAIVFFHGGGWHGGKPDQFYAQCRYLALRGMVTASARYRCIGEFKTTPRECVIDAKSAVRWVREHAAELGVDPARVAAGGGSAGGHIAAATAMVEGFEEDGEDLKTSSRPDALVLYNPVFDNGPDGFGHDLVKDYWEEISPIDNIDARAPPAIVFLGTEDKYIPVATGKKFERLMTEKGVRCDLHLYEGKPHGFFNIWKGKEGFTDTLIKVDRFLASLGFVEGEPTLQAAGPAPASASKATPAPAPAPAPATKAVPADAPNIIFILADDLGYGDLSHVGGLAPTPHCDRLAAEGMRFTDAHTSSSVCTPTRYGILTGRYNWRSRRKAGVLNGFSQPLIPPDRTTIAGFLRDRGYHAGAVGKWHLGIGWQKLPNGEVRTPQASYVDPKLDPRKSGHTSAKNGWEMDYGKPVLGPLLNGFDFYWGIAASLDMAPYLYIAGDRSVGIPMVEKAFALPHRPGPATEDFEADQCLIDFARQSRRYIAARAKDASSPFFLYLALTSPHRPHVPSQEWIGKSPLGVYGDFLMETDWVVGEVLAELEEQGIDENTLVIFTSDNGCSPNADIAGLVTKGHKPNGDWRGAKADIWEGGHRVPFLVRWPAKVKAGTVSDSTICTVDFFATAAEAAGASADITDTMAEDSYSFLTDLTGTGKTARPTTIHHSINGRFAIREGKWKLVLCPGSGGWSAPRPGKDDALLETLPPVQLYDMEADPGETENLEAQHPERVGRLVDQLAREIKEGRSTPGTPQSNEGVIPFRKSLLALYPQLRQE